MQTGRSKCRVLQMEGVGWNQLHLALHRVTSEQTHLLKSGVAFKGCSHDERQDCNVHLPRMPGWSFFSTSPSASSARSNLVQTKVTLNSTTSPGMRAMQYTGSKSIHHVLFRFSMLFACGIGSSLFFFSVSEPISHYTGWSLHHFCYKDSYSVSRS